MTTDICMGCFEPMNGFTVCSHCGWYEGAVPEHAYHLKCGTVLQGRYIIGNSVGVGGFGITYRAWDANLNSLVAIKEFYPAGLVSRVPGEKDIVIFSGDKKEQFDVAIERFLEEARTMAKFTGHPNIVNVFDFFKENNTAYIVMEFLDGITVKEYLTTLPDSKVPVDTALLIVNKILDALTEIHSKGVIHRDISPDNIDITVNNSIKIFDLGAAKLAKGDKEESRSIVVKTGYTPPEQYRAKSKQGPFTDLYSVGAVLYKLITGITPEESIDRIVEDHLQKPSKLGVEIDINLERAIMKALALKSELRFQSAQQFKDAISNKKMVDFPEDELIKRRRIRLAFTSAIAVFTAAFITYFAMYMTDYVKGVDYLVANDDAISVCFPVSDDAVTAQKQNEIYQDIVDKFIENAAKGSEEEEGNKFEVELLTVPQSQYYSYLVSQKEAGKLPTVFSTEHFGDEVTDYAAKLDLLLDSVSENEFIIKNQYKEAYPHKYEIPTGICANVIYVNQAASRSAGTEVPASIDDIGELFDTAEQKDNVSTVAVSIDNFDDTLCAMTEGNLYDSKSGKINPESENAFAKIDKALTKQGFDYNAEMPIVRFVNNNLIYYIDDTAELDDIRNDLPGYYQILPLTHNGNLVVSATDHFGISVNADDNEKLVGMQFIRFLFTDYAQDLMHIQNKISMPLNETTLTNYLNFNGDIGFVADYTSKLKVMGEARHKCYEFNTQLYNNMIIGDGKFSDIKSYMNK